MGPIKKACGSRVPLRPPWNRDACSHTRHRSAYCRRGLPIFLHPAGFIGFGRIHSHQKQWLGPRARHTDEAGMALLTDGALRWNRKRQNQAASTRTTPLVFTGGTLRAADDLHLRLTGTHLYDDFDQSLRIAPAPQEAHQNATHSHIVRWTSGVLQPCQAVRRSLAIGSTSASGASSSSGGVILPQ